MLSRSNWKIVPAVVVPTVLAFALVAPVHAGLTVLYNPGTTQITSGLSGFSTTGAMMDGMSVTATFSDSSSESLAWADIDSDSGGVSGTGWSLREDGDTFGGSWTLTNTSGKGLTSISLDAGAGDSVFDINWSPYPGTDGSANGWTFSLVSGGAGLDITATYSGIVAISGSDPVGDLWRYLGIGITSAGGLASGSALVYIADTDNLEFAGDIEPVPAPGAAVLACIGLGIVGYVKRRLS